MRAEEKNPKELVIATRNPGKIREIADVLSPLALRLLSLRDFPLLSEVVEDGATFAENASIKARAVARQTERFALADDSGLVVEALGGRPGIFSSRFAGEGATDADRYRKLLDEMTAIPEGRRQAFFICAMALSSPEGKTRVVEGECRGRITFSPRGDEGFGYDPVFFVPELGRTMAELLLEVKNRISHRARALEKIKSLIAETL